MAPLCTVTLPATLAEVRTVATTLRRLDTSITKPPSLLSLQKVRHVIWVNCQPAQSASRNLRHCSACTKCVTSFASFLSLHKVRNVIWVTKCVTLFASLFSLHCTKCATLFFMDQPAQSASLYLRHCSVCTKCVTLLVIAPSAQSASRYLSLFSLHKELTDVMKGCRLIA